MTDKDKTKQQKPEEKKEKKTKKEKPPQKKAKQKEEDKAKEKIATEEPTEKDKEAEEEKEVLPPLDFSSLVLPFFTQALFKLGQLNQGGTKDQEGKLELAKRMIDLLDLLKSRTQGNLKPEEQKFIDQSLHQLRMAYMQQAKIISL